MAKKAYDLLFKLLLIGDSGVGKTCILFRFSDDAFNTTFISTIGIDFKIKTLDIKGKKIKLQICTVSDICLACHCHSALLSPICISASLGSNLGADRFPFRSRMTSPVKLGDFDMVADTAGQERFYTITTSYYRGAMGIMLVYDISNPKSFDNIAKWLRNIDEHANEDVEKMILGNKCDMEDKRMISKERGEAIAREHGIRFLETSAKANINIERAFRELAESILNKQMAGKEQTDYPDKVRVTTQDIRGIRKCC